MLFRSEPLTLSFDEDICETRFELCGDIKLVGNQILGEVGATIMEDAVEMNCSLEIYRPDINSLILRLVALAPAREDDP